MKLISTLLSIATISAAMATSPKPTTNWSQYFSWTPGKDMPKLIKEARKRQQYRKTATGGIDTSLMSPEYQKLRDGIINVKTGEELAGMLKTLDSKVDSYPEDAKMLGSLLLLLKPMRGVVYRMIPMVEKPKITHSFLRNQVKQIASNMRLYLPFEHWEAGFSYLTEPYDVGNGKAVSQFENPKLFSKDKTAAIQQYQDFLESEVYPEFAKAANRIQGITFKHPVVWDNRLVFGATSFQGDDTENRYRYVQEGEKHLALSSLHLGMHYLNYVTAYDINDVLKLSYKVGRLYGIDGFDGEVDGTPNYKISKEINKFPNLFVMRKDGQEKMERSFQHLREGIRQVRLAREEVKGEAPNRFLVLNPEKIDPWDENFEKQMAVAECLVGKDSDEPGVCPVHSAITGEVVKVDLYAFYHQAPKDLKSLMATDWNLTSNEITNKKLKVTYPNYFWGSPTSWDKKSFSAYFPEITSGKDVAKNVRVLRQAYGGEFFGAPFAFFVE